jgi:capsular exopolysaccharide synthesis family protein
MRQSALKIEPELSQSSSADHIRLEGVGAFRFSPEVVVISDPQGARAEAIRTLRTHIVAQHLDAGRRGLAICGASAGVGATFVAVNLAIALAQVGVKVLLIDGDLRNSQMGALIEPKESTLGLRECLGGQAQDLSAFVQADVLENFSLMYSGSSASNAQELIASERFAQVIARCSRDYDIVIVDTPPANTCADGRRISTVVGYSVIVAKRHVSFVGDLKTLADQLRTDRAQIVGSVLNEE